MAGKPPYSSILMSFGIPVSENAPGFHYFPEKDTMTATEEAIHIAAQETTGAEPGDKEPDKDRPDAVGTWRHWQRDSISTSTPGAPGNQYSHVGHQHRRQPWDLQSGWI